MQMGYQALDSVVTAKTTVMTTTPGTTALNTAAQGTLATALHDTAEAKWLAEIWTANETSNTQVQTVVQNLLDGSLATTKKTADDAHKTAQLAEAVGTSQKTQADTNLARAKTLLTAL